MRLVMDTWGTCENNQDTPWISPKASIKDSKEKTMDQAKLFLKNLYVLQMSSK